MEQQTIVLTDEDGQEHEFNIVDIIAVEGEEYAILVEPEQEQAIALRLERDEQGQEFLVEIEDDEEWNMVAEAWRDYEPAAEDETE